MNYPQNRLSRAMVVIVILMGGIFSVVSPAHAQGIRINLDDTIPSGEVVENDAFLAGTTVQIDGDVNGDVFAGGGVVEVNGKIEGSLFAAGQNVVINGTVGGTVYAAAVTLDIGPEAELDNNLYFIGASLNTEQGSVVKRDLVVVSMGANLSGEIDRNTVGMIGPWELFKWFMDLIGRPVFEPGTSSSSLEPSFRTESQPVLISGFIPWQSSLLADQAADSAPAVSGKIIQAGQLAQTDSGVDSEQVTKWLGSIGVEFVTLLIFGLIGIWLFAPFLKRSGEKLESKPLQSTGIGLLGLVISVALIGVVILVAVLILMLGVGLGALGLWDLAWAVWGVGFSSLGLAFWLSLLFVSYGTKVIVAFLVGTLILRRLAPKSLQYKILPLLLGLLIYVLLAWLPYFGWVVAVMVNAVGLGAAWLAYRDIGAEKTHEAALEEVAASKTEESAESE
ncbi:MAG: polymer-forming cytoskeletal protein [Anaerolineales bacterium]|jgi:cytoskeletal protein CcmA (bactofilin family)